MSDSNNKNERPWFLSAIYGIVILLFSGVLAYKLIVTPIDISTMDFPNLLALLLAFFSIGLSALFYFKATDTSNAFYDNTYKFTKEIAELLVKIESGFGERLRHLDEGYNRIQDRFTFPIPTKDEENKAQDELKKGEEELQKIIEERNKVIDSLLAKTNLADKEKSKILAELERKEMQLLVSRREIDTLKERFSDLVNTRDLPDDERLGLIKKVRFYLKKTVIPRFSISNLKNMPRNRIQMEWKDMLVDFESEFIDDMARLGYINEVRALTHNGIQVIQSL